MLLRVPLVESHAGSRGWAGSTSLRGALVEDLIRTSLPSLRSFVTLTAKKKRYERTTNGETKLFREKRRKDLAKKAKKEEKRLRKLHAKENPTSEEADTTEPVDDSEETKDEG